MNPYEKYQQQMVTTMTQGDMLLKLYDEALKQVGLACTAIDASDIESMARSIEKAQRILRYLRTTLDFRFPVSYNLAKLYDFFDNQLMMASIKKEKAPLYDIEPLIVDLRDTFDQCVKLDRAQRTGQAAGDVV